METGSSAARASSGAIRIRDRRRAVAARARWPGGCSERKFRIPEAELAIAKRPAEMGSERSLNHFCLDRSAAEAPPKPVPRCPALGQEPIPEPPHLWAAKGFAAEACLEGVRGPHARRRREWQGKPLFLKQFADQAQTANGQAGVGENRLQDRGDALEADAPVRRGAAKPVVVDPF